MTTKRRKSIRFPGTRLSTVVGSVAVLLAIWFQIARSGQIADLDEMEDPATRSAIEAMGVPTQALPSTGSPLAVATAPVRPTAAQLLAAPTQAPVPTPVPRHSVSRGS